MRGAALLLAAVGLAGLAWLASFDPGGTARCYLVAFMWLSALPLGALAFLMIGHATGGRWQVALGPSLRAAAATTPFLIPAFLPVLLILPLLYAWAVPEQVAHSHLWQHRAFYMNPTGFALRGLAALLIWSYLAWRMQSWRSTPGVQKVACPGLAAHLFLTGMVAMDWMGSVDEHFRSSIFGLILMLTQSLTGFALLTLLASRTHAHRPAVLYDLGSLLLALVMLTTYLEMSQLVIFWMGNAPEETGWLSVRVFEGWRGLAMVLFVGQRLLPFLLLIWGPVKKSPRKLACAAVLISALAPLHFAWLVLPSYHHAEIVLSPALPAALAALGGTWWLAFSTLLARREREEEAPT